MDHHGIAPGAFLDFVHAIDVSPVPQSPALDAALRALDGRKLIFTNGSVAHAERVMARLGVAERFTGVFDIVAADYQPKPNPATYAALIERHGVDPRAAAMFEDIPRNLVPAAALTAGAPFVLQVHASTSDRQVVVEFVGHRVGLHRVDAAPLRPGTVWRGR